MTQVVKSGVAVFVFCSNSVSSFFLFVYSSQGAKFGSGPCMKFRLIVKVPIVTFLQGVQCTLQLTSICFFTDNLFPFEFQNVKSLFES